MRRLLKAALRIGFFVVVVAVGLFIWFVAWPVHTVPALERVDEYVWLDQGWGDGPELRVATALLLHGAGHFDAAGRLVWRSALRLVRESRAAAVTRALRRSRAHAQVPIPRGPGAEPRQSRISLPIGFTRHFDAAIGEDVLDITCAACHTGELHYTANGRTRAIRIDGGPAMHAFTDMKRGSFAPELLAS